MNMPSGFVLKDSRKWEDRRGTLRWWSVELGEGSGRRSGLGRNNYNILKGIIGKSGAKPMKHGTEMFPMPSYGSVATESGLQLIISLIQPFPFADLCEFSARCLS